MMRSAPRFWFWSHDIQPDQVADLNMPGMRLLRLAGYRPGPDATRRFAALYHDAVSARLEHLHAYPLDLDAVGHALSVRFAVVAAV